MSQLACLTVAYHEAGHALADYRLGFKNRTVSIAPDGESAGRVRHFNQPGFFNKFDQEQPSRGDIAKAHDWIVSLLAGGEAQRKFRPTSLRRHHTAHDNECINTLLERFFHEDERTALLKYLRVRAKILIQNPTNWIMISDLAKALVERRSLTGQEVVALFRQSFIRARSEQMREAREQRLLSRQELVR